MIKASLFAAQEREQKIDKLGDLLSRLERHIDFAAIAASVDRLAPRADKSKGGRPAFATELMVRILVIQQMYNLSDEAMEFQLLDRLSFQRFVGLRQSSQIPDATLIPAPIVHLSKDDKGQIEQGQIPTNWSAAKRRQKDLDAKWTKKHGKSYHGYKLSANVDKRYKLMRNIHISTANEHDTHHLETVLDKSNTSQEVFADKGYVNQEREKRLRQEGWRLRIQRKAKKGKAISDCQKRRNCRLAQTRSRVEHVFAALAQMGSKALRTIGLARAQVTLKAASYNMRPLVSLHSMGLQPF